MDIEKIRDDYFNLYTRCKDVKSDYFFELVSQMSNEDKEELKTLLTS